MTQVTSATRGQRRVEATHGRGDWAPWPRYEAATEGLRNYWYPVAWSRKIGRRPVQIKVLGEKIMFKRDKGVVYALHDRCPHRGVPLSHKLATQEFPGTWTCCYHGWTFDLKTGELVAVITDGPESPIRGRVSVRSYPVQERIGLVWVYIGDGDPPPVETAIPAELLASDAVVLGRLTRRPGDWRFGAENGIDEGHAKFLHRNALWAFKRQMPTWNIHRIEPTGDGWITRINEKVHYRTEFPGLGFWPKKKWWKTPKQRTRKGVSIRLPGVLRVRFETWDHFEWWVPQDGDHHFYLQLVCKRGGWLKRTVFRLYYLTWVRWVFHVMFNGEDALMVDVMDAPPERLYRPDGSLVAWRRLVENEARPGASPVDPEYVKFAPASRDGDHRRSRSQPE